MLHRHSKAYLDRKAAWLLLQDRPIWEDFLKPLLEIKAKADTRMDITTIEDTYRVAKDHAVIDYARILLKRIERYAEEFPKLAVNPES